MQKREKGKKERKKEKCGKRKNVKKTNAELKIDDAKKNHETKREVRRDISEMKCGRRNVEETLDKKKTTGRKKEKRKRG
jgi:hypothetical protein